MRPDRSSMKEPLDKIRQGLFRYFRNQVAFGFRNYRLYTIGQGLSVLGTWLQRIAMLWLAYRLTNSAFILGLIGFSEQVPIFFIAPFAGVYADKWDKRRALIFIECFAMAQAILIAILTFTNLIEIWHLIGLSLCLGIINSFQVPIRQSFVVEMVNRDKTALTNAIALNSTLFNMSRMIGPSLAGLMIAAVGEAWCFVANAFSFGLVIWTYLSMKELPPSPQKKDQAKVWYKLKEGFQYVRKKEIMRILIIMLALVSFSNASFRTLAPVFAKEILGGGANTFGFLMSASGVGAIIAAVYLTNNRSMATLNKLVHYTGIFLGIALILFGFSKWLLISLALMAFGGASRMIHTASTNTLLQLYTEDDKRGRVMSFYTISQQGTTPFGSFVSGSLANFAGAPWAVVIMGSLSLVGTLLLRNRLSPP